jgi:hypothetical protein
LIKYRALVTDVILKGRMDGWEVAKQSREIDPAFPIVCIAGAAVGALAVARCAQQRSFRKAGRASAGCHCGFSTSRYQRADLPSNQLKAWRLLQNDSGDESDDESAAYDPFCIAGSLSFP